MLTSYLLSSSLASVASNPMPFSAIITQENNPLQSKIDPIQEQMLKTNDPVLEVIHRIEDGTVKRFLEEQKKTPSATWIGDLVDRIFGLGRFHETNQPAKTADNFTQVPEKLKKICSNSLPIKDFVVVTMPTSFESETNENNTCSYPDSEDYKARINIRRQNKPGEAWAVSLDPERCLFLGKCIYDAAKACENSNCFPCDKPQDGDLLKAAIEVKKHSDRLYLPRNINNLTYYVLNNFPAKNLEYMTWRIDTWSTDPSRGEVNIWKALQIFKVMEKIIQTCESKEAQHDQLIKLNKELQNKHNSMRNKFEIAAVISLVVGSVLGYGSKRYLDYLHKVKEIKS